MTCKIADGITLNFLRSGLVLQSHDLSTRSERGRYAHVKANITRKAGDLVNDSGIVGEPVTLTFGGVAQNRYIYGSESLELSGDEAWLTLYDARKILSYGRISKTFDEVTLEDVAEYIVDNRDDPENVITGVRVLDEETASEITQSRAETLIEFWGGENADLSTGFLRYADLAAAFITRVAFRIALTKVDDGGFDFEDVSPDAALRMVEDEFAVDSWVETDGTLWIGKPEGRPINLHGVPPNIEESGYSIADYNITKGVTPVTSVRLEGASSWKKQENPWVGPNAKLYPIAEAWLPGEEGAAIAPDEKVRLYEPAAVERRAEAMLIEAAKAERNGNIVFNGLASEKQDELATMSVGDVLVVAPQIENYCHQQTEGGVFVVEEVQHKVNTRQGWRIVAEVAAIPDEIETMAVWYDPRRDKAYEDLEEFRNEN
jgi:hypothetical protein